jgi:hypothetical protein
MFSRWEEKVLDERRESIEEDEREEKDIDFNRIDLVSECNFASIGEFLKLANVLVARVNYLFSSTYFCDKLV